MLLSSQFQRRLGSATQAGRCQREQLGLVRAPDPPHGGSPISITHPFDVPVGVLCDLLCHQVVNGPRLSRWGGGGALVPPTERPRQIGPLQRIPRVIEERNVRIDVFQCTSSLAVFPGFREDRYVHCSDGRV